MTEVVHRTASRLDTVERPFYIEMIHTRRIHSGPPRPTPASDPTIPDPELHAP
jgi:hypothetical protein